MTEPFVITHNTAVISDLHLTDAEVDDPKKPYWKNFKKRRHFFDDSLALFLEHIKKQSAPLPVELILNGDIFDYDSVMSVPDDSEMGIKYSLLEKQTGLDSQEEKSLFKTHVILNDHVVFVRALKEFIQAGNKVIFVLGNHDIELYWPSTQKEIVSRLTDNKEQEAQVIFCEWFYISQKDTLIEHGHQYDPYCICIDPINPLILKRKKYKIRLPFGNLANRFILNRFGLKNPHHDESYVKTGKEFMIFFFKYEIRVQPFLIFYWLFGALRTLQTSLAEGFFPASKDPLTYEAKIKSIAKKSNATTHDIFALRELHAHPSVHNPIDIIRELWLDRFFMLVVLIWGCWQIFTTFNLFANFSLWWFIIPVLFTFPLVGYYAQDIKSDVHVNLKKGEEVAPIAAQIVNVKRVVHGHTHVEVEKRETELEFFNPGSWSPYFDEIECIVNKRVKKYVWIQKQGDARVASLLTWEK